MTFDISTNEDLEGDFPVSRHNRKCDFCHCLIWTEIPPFEYVDHKNLKKSHIFFYIERSTDPQIPYPVSKSKWQDKGQNRESIKGYVFNVKSRVKTRQVIRISIWTVSYSIMIPGAWGAWASFVCMQHPSLWQWFDLRYADIISDIFWKLLQSKMNKHNIYGNMVLINNCNMR